MTEVDDRIAILVDGPQLVVKVLPHMPVQQRQIPAELIERRPKLLERRVHLADPLPRQVRRLARRRVDLPPLVRHPHLGVRADGDERIRVRREGAQRNLAALAASGTGADGPASSVGLAAASRRAVDWPRRERGRRGARRAAASAAALGAQAALWPCLNEREAWKARFGVIRLWSPRRPVRCVL